MNQAAFTLVALLVMFIAFITARGSLHTYIGLLT